MARLIQAGNARSEAFVKALVTGQSGSGKTTAVAKAPRPLVLEPAPQAIPSIRAANPDAMVFILESMQDVRDALYSLRQAKPIEIDGEPGLLVKMTQDPSNLKKGEQAQVYGEFEIQSVVLDDLEEVQEMAKREIQGHQDTLTQQQWGILLDQNMAMLRNLRSVRANVFVCAKVLRTQDKDGQVWELALYGSKFKPLLPGLFNCMCFMYRKNKTEGDPREYVAGFKLPEEFLTKSHPALAAVEDPDPSVWVGKVRDHTSTLDGVEIPTDPNLLPKSHKPPVKMTGRRGSRSNGSNKPVNAQDTQSKPQAKAQAQTAQEAPAKGTEQAQPRRRQRR